MATAIKAQALVRSTGATLARTTRAEATLSDGEQEWTLAIPRFTDYRRDMHRHILSARAYILPAEKEDGFYAHATWIGSREPPQGTPRTSRRGHEYMDRYMTVDSSHGDGTWISLKHTRPLNTGKVVVSGSHRSTARYTALSASVVVADVVLLREEHFSRYSFSPGLRSAVVLTVSPEQYRTRLTVWGDNQSGSSVQVPRSRQGNFTLSAVVRYSEDLTYAPTYASTSSAGDSDSRRTTSVSITVPLQ